MSALNGDMEKGMKFGRCLFLTLYYSLFSFNHFLIINFGGLVISVEFYAILSQPAPGVVNNFSFYIKNLKLAHEPTHFSNKKIRLKFVHTQLFEVTKLKFHKFRVGSPQNIKLDWTLFVS